MQYAKAESPKGLSCYSKIDLHSLANYKKSCDVARANLKDTEFTLNKCIAAGSTNTAWWSDPKFVVGGFALTFTIGAIVGLLVK